MKYCEVGTYGDEHCRYDYEQQGAQHFVDPQPVVGVCWCSRQGACLLGFLSVVLHSIIHLGQHLTSDCCERRSVSACRRWRRGPCQLLALLGTRRWSWELWRRPLAKLGAHETRQPLAQLGMWGWSVAGQLGMHCSERFGHPIVWTNYQSNMDWWTQGEEAAAGRGKVAKLSVQKISFFGYLGLTAKRHSANRPKEVAPKLPGFSKT